MLGYNVSSKYDTLCFISHRFKPGFIHSKLSLGSYQFLLHQSRWVYVLLSYLQLDLASQAAAGHFNVYFISLTNEKHKAYSCHYEASRVARRAAYTSVLFHIVIRKSENNHLIIAGATCYLLEESMWSHVRSDRGRRKGSSCLLDRVSVYHTLPVVPFQTLPRSLQLKASWLSGGHVALHVFT